MPLRRRLPLARSFQCKLPGVNRPARFNRWFHRGRRTWPGRQRRPVHLGRFRADTHLWVAGQRAECRDAFPEYGGLDGSCRSGPCKAQSRKFPEARVACGYEFSDAPCRIPGGALHIRDQLHLVPGKLGEGQADHYIFPPVPCPVIDARGDLDDRNSRWQNRQTAMLARTCPGPAGARGTPGRALGRCGTIDAKPPGAPSAVTLAASCILRLFS